MNQPLDPENAKIAVEIIVEADEAQLAQITENIHKEAKGLIAPAKSEVYGSRPQKWRITFDLIGSKNYDLRLEDVGDWVLAAGLQTVKSINFTYLPLS